MLDSIALSQMQSVTSFLRQEFNETLVAIYLHGSAISGVLHPQSDIDFLVVVNKPLARKFCKKLAAGLLLISAPHPAKLNEPRCLEVIVMLKEELMKPGFPAKAEFIYGEWLRDTCTLDAFPMQIADPEVTLILAQAQLEAHPLFGPAAELLFPEISDEHIRAAMRMLLPVLLEGLRGDERNVLLTLARMWHTAETGKFVSKEKAANWVIARETVRIISVIQYARDAYLGALDDDWGGYQLDAQYAAEYLSERISDRL